MRVVLLATSQNFLGVALVLRHPDFLKPAALKLCKEAKDLIALRQMWELDRPMRHLSLHLFNVLGCRDLPDRQRQLRFAPPTTTGISRSSSAALGIGAKCW